MVMASLFPSGAELLSHQESQVGTSPDVTRCGKDVKPQQPTNLGPHKSLTYVGFAMSANIWRKEYKCPIVGLITACAMSRYTVMERSSKMRETVDNFETNTAIADVNARTQYHCILLVTSRRFNTFWLIKVQTCDLHVDYWNVMLRWENI